MRFLIAAALLIPLAGCPSGGDDSTGTAGTDGAAASRADEPAGPVLVWADPLLSVVLDGVHAEFTERFGPGFTPLYMERGELIARLSETKPPSLPDAFITADQELFTLLRDGGFIVESTARTFAGDRLALVKQAGAGYQTASLFDSYKLRFEQFAIGQESTAIGYYAEQALKSEGCFNRLEDRMVRFDRTADLLAALEEGGRRIGMAFASSAVQNPGMEVMMLVDEERHADIRYQVMLTPGQEANDGAVALLRFLSEEEEIQALLGGYGLLDRDEALIENR